MKPSTLAFVIRYLKKFKISGVRGGGEMNEYLSEGATVYCWVGAENKIYERTCDKNRCAKAEFCKGAVMITESQMIQLHMSMPSPY